MFKIGDRVTTLEGKGVIKNIDLPESVNKRFGVLHDVFPNGFDPETFKGRLLYYYPREMKKVVADV